MNTTEKLTEKKAFTLLLALTAILSTVIYWDFLTFSKLYLYKDIGSDTLNVFYPEYVHLANYLHSDGWPGWSFSQGMGQNIFPHSIGDPFDLLLVLLPAEYIAYALVYIQVLKILLAAIIFYLYLRVLSLVPLTAVIGALLYAYSGYMILGGSWYVFSSDAVIFASLLYAFERYLRDQVWYYFPLAVALASAGISFNLYLYALFFLIYGVFRYVVTYGWQAKSLLLFFSKLTALGLLGLGISATFIVANVQEMLNSPRAAGDASFFALLMSQTLVAIQGELHNATAIMRLFSSDLLGTGNNFRGWYNYLEAPMFYCGLLSLLLAPQVFVSLQPKHKVAYALFALIFILPVVMPFLRYAFWAFSGDYYRLYSAFVALVLLFFCVHALNHIFKTGRINLHLLLITLAVLLIVLYFPYDITNQENGIVIDKMMRMLATGFLLAYTAVLIVMRSSKWQLAAQYSLLLIVCLELTSFSWQTVNDRSALSSAEFQAKTGYNDYSNEAIAWLKQRDPSLYRIEKAYSSGPADHISINDAKVQGYFGTSSYHSFNQLNYISFLEAVGIINGSDENATRWATGMTKNAFLLSFSSVKYILVKNTADTQMYAQVGYQKIHQIADVIILENPLYLPFGFTYDSYLAEADFMSLPVSFRPVALLKSLVISSPENNIESQLRPFSLATINPNYGMSSYVDDIQARRSTMFDMTSYTNKRISGAIHLSEPRALFFTLPYDRGWTATVNGKNLELQKTNIGFSSLLLPAGQHTIELAYKLPYFNLSLVISLLSLVGFISLIWKQKLKSEQVNLSESTRS